MFIPLTTRPPTTARPESSCISPNNWNVLADFWYPVALSRELQDKPIAAKLLDVNLVLYRGQNGSVGVALDVCPHRHIKLSTGTVVDGEIVCPFHGLRFDPTGRCTTVPALGGAVKLPASYRVRSFPSREQYGLIWTCLGNAEAHAIPNFPALQNVAPAELNLLGPQSWPVSAARQIENFFDLAHLPLVHADTIGGPAMSVMKPGVIHEDTDAVILRADYVETHPGMEPRPCTFTYRIVLPFAIDFRIEDDSKQFMYAFNIPSPASAHESRVFQIFRITDSAHRPLPEAQQGFMNAFLTVNQQDIDVLSGLAIQDMPLDQHHEIHLPVDNICGAYRSRLRELGLGLE